MLDWLRRRSARSTHPIDLPLWRQATAPWLFMRGMTPDEEARLKALCEGFLARKHYSGTHGLQITDLIKVEIAAQAAILVLELGLDWYDGWSEIILYPSQFAPQREEVDEAGVVHLSQDPMAGEAWLGGPVILSYEDVAMSADESLRVAGYNVVIHEFAHKLDMRNGEANGFPPLHGGMSAADWKREFSEAYRDFSDRVDIADDCAERDGGAALDALPIDPYAASSADEFFAVTSEAFFETPEMLQPAYPGVYGQLRLFYRQDPAARLARAG